MNQRLDTLREKASHLPDSPGVYLWLDSYGQVLYVGKAKNLHARVLSYFRGEGDGRIQVPRLMEKVADLDYIVTGTEIEALVTEANLARARKPRYNVRLKDDKRYPYIKITREPLPRIFLTRTLAEDGSRYLGPYTDVGAVRRTLELVHAIFPLRHCRQALTGPKPERACLNYQIGRCSGPCMGYIGREEYNRLVEDAYRFIQGRNAELLRDLEHRMNEASEAMQFEQAANFRDRIAALRTVASRRKAFATAWMTGDWDVVNVAMLDNEACVVIMEVREGNVLGKKNYLVGGVQYTGIPAILSSLLAQIYTRTSELPPEIHLPAAPDDAAALEELCTMRRGGTVRFVYPQRGEKARLLQLAATNAEHILRETVAKRDRAQDVVPGVVRALGRDLRLSAPPRTIACIDISHLGGTDTVASLVVFRDGKPDKKSYRRYRIRTVAGVDDFASMREVVERYFTAVKAVEVGPPDLLLVDGGKGQLSSAKSVLDRLGFGDQPVAGLAKRLEEVFLPGASEPQNIPRTSSALHLLQRIRDEAHRFAHTYQQTLQTKRTIGTSLTAVPGIGPVTARALLRAFGSVAAVRQASESALAEVPGIGAAKAAAIHRALAEMSGNGSDNEENESKDE